MLSFFLVLIVFGAFIVAYHTYGRWLAYKIFRLDADARVPSRELSDGVDYVPSKRSIVFGHHFTSIAGTGPIVGPAIAVFWGWLPALLWVVLGSIFIGAVHDFGSLIVSLRNRGQTVGEIAGRLISPRAKILFLLVLFFALTIVLAIFGLVIASIFNSYPGSVVPVWVSLPIAIFLGLTIRNNPNRLFPLTIVSLVVIYFSIYVGVYHLPIRIGDLIPVANNPESIFNGICVWTYVLLAYCAVASVLPVWLLLQPRDFINSYQLFTAMALLLAGLLFASLTGQADLFRSAPAIVASEDLPLGTPPIWPFLFITIACGAVSGFHCLVSSGTSSKQIACETDAHYIGYGSMLAEGALATVVILACCAGIGMGVNNATNDAAASSSFDSKLSESDSGTQIQFREAWNRYYSAQHWTDFNLRKKVSAFVDGGANFLSAIGLPMQFGLGVISVLVACFAATTLDTATRLQRYVIQEIGTTIRFKPLQNKYFATLTAVFLGGLIAVLPGPKGPGTGGLLLWPLFGATNQLLAGLALLVTTFFLWRRNQPVWFVAIPMLLMVVLPAWALLWQLFSTETVDGKLVGWWWSFKEKWLLVVVGLATMALQVWMLVEAAIVWRRARGVLEQPLPPLNEIDNGVPLESTGGRSC